MGLSGQRWTEKVSCGGPSGGTNPFVFSWTQMCLRLRQCAGYIWRFNWPQMKLSRFIYLNAMEIASLYSQLRGEDVVETLFSMESSRTSGWKAALTAFIGGSTESSASAKEATLKKVSLRPENMLQEIRANLKAQGTLARSIAQALVSVGATNEPAWFEARHPFSMPFQVKECNDMGAAVFLSGFDPLGLPIDGVAQMRMSAGLNNFPGAREGRLGVSGHDALFFRALGGANYAYSVFGSLFRSGKDFQIKPYAIQQ